MDPTPEPMIKLEPGGSAPLLSYNVPEPTTYSGRNFIDLQLPAGHFKPSPVALRSVAAGPPSGVDSVGAAQDPTTPDQAEAGVSDDAGPRLQVYRSMFGHLAHTWVEAPASTPAPAPTPAAHADDSMAAAGERAGDVAPRINAAPIVIEDPVLPYVEVAIGSPADGATLSGPHTGVAVTVQGGVETNRTLSAVEVRIGSGAFQAATRTGGTWTFSGTITQPGATQITARARAGILTHEDSVMVNVALALPPDTTGPALAVSSPADGTSISGPASGLAVTVAGTSSDAGGVRTVEVAVGSGPFSAAAPQAAGNWATWTKALTLAPGSHTINVRASDMAGNITPRSVTVTITLAPPADTANPTVTITSPAPGAAISGPFGGATVVVKGTAVDPSGIRDVELSIDNNPITVGAQPRATGDWSQWTASVVIGDPGAHTIVARATDNAGNRSSSSVAVTVTLVPAVVSRLKRLILVESYRLSSYLGTYGAGRTIKTFSLLPGERTKISVKTYTKTETDAKSASSILDSFTQESAEDFENSMAKEQSDKQSYDESFKYKVGLEASASWGWGKATVTGEVSGGTNAAREEFAKSISNATQKHSAKASAKRDVQINTSYEVKASSGEETSVEREIQNINVSRTLNFVFRQMNQEFVTILHLVDVRIGFFNVELVNGVETSTYREVTLPQLDALLRDVITDEKRTEVRNAIFHQLANVFDYQDRHHVLVEDEPLRDAAGNVVPFSNYLRLRKEHTSTYIDEATGTRIKVPGVILAANKYVLRTEGVIVEALLGQGDALDGYSHGLQDQAVRARKLENDRVDLEMAAMRLAQTIIKNRDSEGARLYQQLYPPEPTQLMPYVLAPAPASAPATGTATGTASASNGTVRSAPFESK